MFTAQSSTIRYNAKVLTHWIEGQLLSDNRTKKRKMNIQLPVSGGRGREKHLYPSGGESLSQNETESTESHELSAALNLPNSVVLV